MSLFDACLCFCWSLIEDPVFLVGALFLPNGELLDVGILGFAEVNIGRWAINCEFLGIGSLCSLVEYGLFLDIVEDFVLIVGVCRLKESEGLEFMNGDGFGAKGLFSVCLIPGPFADKVEEGPRGCWNGFPEGLFKLFPNNLLFLFLLIRGGGGGGGGWRITFEL